MNRVVMLALCALLLFGCEQKESSPLRVPQKEAIKAKPFLEAMSNPITLLKDPINAVDVESPTEAILTWRRYHTQKPVLIIMSNEPFLEAIPTNLKTKVTDLVLKGSEEEFRNKAVYLRSNSILLHRMALSAALNAKLFSKVIWILPTSQEVAPLDRDKILKALKLADKIPQKELDSFKPSGNRLTGTIKATPFILTSLNNLPPIETPVLLHIESSFFKPLYRNEIKTPLYGLVYSALKAIQSQNWQVEAVTASSFTLGGNNSLAVRFLIKNIIQLLHSPKMLASSPPKTWQYRARAFYLSELIQPEKELDSYLKMEKLSPNDASIKFALFDTSRKLKHGKKALNYLDKAVSLDSAYAEEYLTLAMTAFRKKNSAATVRMVQKAQEADPQNPFISLKAIPLYLSMKMPDKAIPHLKKLREMTWSSTYDPEMKKQLDYWGKEIIKMKQSVEREQKP